MFGILEFHVMLSMLASTKFFLNTVVVVNEMHLL